MFGLPLGKLADVWVRRRLISIGLAFWSGMTALSGTAGSFLQLAGYRIGVGIGEASASPAAFSMLSDYFPPRLRATVLSIYSSGVYIGAGIGIFLGGFVVDRWNAAFPLGNAPLGLAGWQAAFFVVGLPGLAMALWVWTLREPVRGQSEGIATPLEPHPFREFGRELAAVLPVFSLASLVRAGAGRSGVALNLVTAVGLALVAWLLITMLGTHSQWIALCIGLYAAFSWRQGLVLRDPATYAMIFRSRALSYGVVGYAFLAFTAYGIGFWTPPFFMRVHGVNLTETGAVLGVTAALCGWLGVTLGGVVSDRLRRYTPNARLWVGVFTASIPVPFGVLLLTTESTAAAYAYNAILAVGVSMWIGPAASTVNDLVMPRMRATASAFYIMVITFVGLALGPYGIGRASDALEVVGGFEPGEALRNAMLLALLANAVAVSFLLLATRYLPAEETSRLARARAAGEAVE